MLLPKFTLVALPIHLQGGKSQGGLQAQKTLYESINAKIFTWSLQAQNVLRTSGLIIHLKNPERVNL